VDGKLANKFELDFNSVSPDGQLIARMQVQLDALKQWARAVEARQYQLQEGLLTMIGNFETLASILVNKQEVTEEAIAAGRHAFLEKIRQLQEEQMTVAQKKTELWTPNNKIVPVD